MEKIEKRFRKNDDIAAFVMESGAQVAGGVIIYPKGFQKKEAIKLEPLFPNVISVTTDGIS